jgi:branched-chain amino acid aminotransferase
MTAITASERRNEQSALSRVKSANYLQSVLARIEADRNGAQEAILLNARGYVAEASTSNVFAVAGGSLATPSVDSGALPGITRAAVIELAAEARLPVTERLVTPEELLDADEAFLTNSLMEIMPLTELDGQPIGSGRPGPVTQQLAEAYRELVRRETGAG